MFLEIFFRLSHFYNLRTLPYTPVNYYFCIAIIHSSTNKLIKKRYFFGNALFRFNVFQITKDTHLKIFMGFDEYCSYKIKIEEMLSAEFLLKPAVAVMLKNEKN